MNFPLVFGLGALGLAMGGASVLGYTTKIEPICWIVIAIVSMILIAKFGASHPFWHGFFAGLIMGTLNSIMQSAFFTQYLATHPQAAQFRDQIPGGLSMHIFFLITGPVIGAVYGTVIGLLSMLATRFIK
jgi:hypothetical protein